MQAVLAVQVGDQGQPWRALKIARLLALRVCREVNLALRHNVADRDDMEAISCMGPFDSLRSLRGTRLAENGRRPRAKPPARRRVEWLRGQDSNLYTQLQRLVASQLADPAVISNSSDPAFNSVD